MDLTQLTLCGTTGAPRVPPHGHGLFLLDDILKIGQGALEFPAVDRLGSFASVLKGDTQVGTPGTGGLP